MDAVITGETDELVGLSVIDGNDIEHVLDVNEEDGSIPGHTQDGYPDKSSERTDQENETVASVRQFAKWYVYRERGYPTLQPHENPDRIAATLVALSQLSATRFKELFGEYYRQHASHFQSDVEPPIEPPADIDAGEFLRYELDLYLGVDPALEDDLQTLLEAGITEAASKTIETLAEPVDVEFYADDSLGLDITAVSDIRVAYQTGPGDEQVLGVDAPVERDPDAIVQLVPLPSGSIKTFRQLLLHHLGCQIRDCYIEMGVKPPEPFRLLGHGFYQSAQRYRLLDFYDDYFDFDADIPGYRTINIGQNLPGP